MNLYKNYRNSDFLINQIVDFQEQNKTKYSLKIEKNKQDLVTSIDIKMKKAVSFKIKSQNIKILYNHLVIRTSIALWLEY